MSSIEQVYESIKDGSLVLEAFEMWVLDGNDDSYQEGYDQGHADGHSIGFEDGFDEAKAEDDGA